MSARIYRFPNHKKPDRKPSFKEACLTQFTHLKRYLQSGVSLIWRYLDFPIRYASQLTVTTDDVIDGLWCNPGFLRTGTSAACSGLLFPRSESVYQALPEVLPVLFYFERED